MPIKFENQYQLEKYRSPNTSFKVIMSPIYQDLLIPKMRLKSLLELNGHPSSSNMWF